MKKADRAIHAESSGNIPNPSTPVTTVKIKYVIAIETNISASLMCRVNKPI